jgi:hypothetical protein
MNEKNGKIIDSEYWEKKEAKKNLITANLNANNNSIGLLDIVERIGLLKHIKTLDELVTELNGYRNRFKDWSFEGMADSFPQTEQKPINSEEQAQNGHGTPWSEQPITEGQLKAVKNWIRTRPKLRKNFPANRKRLASRKPAINWVNGLKSSGRKNSLFVVYYERLVRI